MAPRNVTGATEEADQYFGLAGDDYVIALGGDDFLSCAREI